MTRVLFTTAFLLGALVVTWMALDFVGSDTLALTVTMIIGGVYVIGFIEQLQFRKTTASLSGALDKANQTIEDLNQWLKQLDPSLQNSVRLRIEGERVALPAPVLTPYLVGLLVMLGLMGTFAGMVITLKGAVVALEGTTELQAIRAGLAAPIGGLGLAFGTSVAGVAASAMLGLISTLSRRERMIETNRLDSMIGAEFRKFSLVHNRQETFKALQFQAQALPDVANTLNEMASKLEAMGENIANKLVSSQSDFHESVSSVYKELAASVEGSLKQSIDKSSEMVGEGIRPILREAMEQITADSNKALANTTDLLKTQVTSLADGFANSTTDVNAKLQKAIATQNEASQQLVKDLKDEMANYAGEFTTSAEKLVQTFNDSSEQWIDKQLEADNARIDNWDAVLKQSQEQSSNKLQEATSEFIKQLSDVREHQLSSFETIAGQLKGLSGELTERWQQTSDETVSQQESMIESFKDSITDLSETTLSNNTKVLGDISELLAASEKLVEARLESEKAWVEEQDSRVAKISNTLSEQLQGLRVAEEQRSEAAIERFEKLEGVVTEHLTTLGQALEEPMTRLIETASETPKAAAEVIEKLRAEISNNVERDNDLLEERKGIMEELNQLLGSIKESSTKQQESIDTLVESSTSMMKDVSEHFANNINSEVSKINDVADQFETATADMSAMAESFSAGVQLFSESNQGMLDNLARVEESLDASSARNDEQLAYYVTQAREIIDHSMMSQKGILEELKQLSRQPDLFAEEVS